MAFGISKILSIIARPHLAILHYKRYKLLKRFRTNNLKVGFDVSVVNSKVGDNIFLGNQVKLYETNIGSNSYVNTNTKIIYTDIGKFCSIGSDVEIGMGIHPTDLVSSHPAFYSNNKAFETFADKVHFKEYDRIVIENDVWIGTKVIIMGGVKIGTGAIVAAGAVVTKDVKPYEIVGGVPAKHIKFRIPELEIEEILKSKWWDKPTDWLRRNHLLFLDRNKFLYYFSSNQEQNNMR